MALRNGISMQPTHVRVVVMLLGALGLGAVALWSLHQPNPQVRAPVPIDRNSFLPHRYAGPCVNCHFIKAVGPVTIDATTMNRFALTPTERQLIVAGQRVEVPALSDRMRIPAITPTDGLPHDYVGVCSNCHVVLNVRPSPEFMQQAMRRAGQPLVGLSPWETARGGALPDSSRSRSRRLWGYAALPTGLFSVVFVAMHARARPRASERGPRPTRWLIHHQWTALLFCSATALHWFYSDRGNNFLHVALVTVGWLAAGGLVLHHRRRLPGIGDGSWLRLGQWLALAALIALLAFGHFLGSFY